MKLSWVLANDTNLDPAIDLTSLKEIGSFWGGWQTWRNCNTDNVICNEFDRAKSLLQRKFNENCNFYIPDAIYQSLDRPAGVCLYGGTTQLDLENKEEIIAMHLSASQSDIVLLLGFDWSLKLKNPDRLLEHRAQNYRTLVKQTIISHPQVQWVLIDRPDETIEELEDITNITYDTIDGVLALAKQL